MTKRRALVDIVAFYVVAAVLGAGLFYAMTPAKLFGFLPGLEDERLALFERALAADLLMTWFIYGCSVVKKNSSAYDAYWSVIPFYFVLGFAVLYPPTSWGWAQWLTALLVSAWSWRLTLNWVRGWTGWDHEDWRYVDFRRAHGKAFELTNFFGIHLFPTIIVFAACAGLFWVYGAETERPLWYVVGGVVGGLGIGLEFVADNQLARFRERPEPSSQDILDSGLWGVMRYPNYLGEMLFWFGVAFCGLGAGAPLWTFGGAVAMVALFAFASIPMKDKRMASRKPAFGDYRSRVPALWPRLGR